MSAIQSTSTGELAFVHSLESIVDDHVEHQRHRRSGPGVGRAGQRHQLPNVDYRAGRQPAVAGHRSSKRHSDRYRRSKVTTRRSPPISRRWRPPCRRWAQSSTFQNYQVQMSDPTQMSVTAATSASPGSYQFQALQLASTQVSLSQGFANAGTQTRGHRNADDFQRRRSRAADAAWTHSTATRACSWAIDPDHRRGRTHDDRRSLERLHRQRRHQRDQ